MQEVPEDPIKQFWHYVSEYWGALENIQEILPELDRFKDANPTMIPGELSSVPTFTELSNDTQIFLNIIDSLAHINPLITCSIGLNQVRLPEEADRVVLAEKKRELEANNIDIPKNIKVVPAYIRYDFIIFTGDIECVEMVNHIY